MALGFTRDDIPWGSLFVIGLTVGTIAILTVTASPTPRARLRPMRANGKRKRARKGAKLRANASSARYTVTIPEPGVVREAFAQWEHDYGEEHPAIPTRPTLREASAYVSEYGFGLLLHRGKETILVEQSGTSSDGRRFKMRDGYGAIELTRRHKRR